MYEVGIVGHFEAAHQLHGDFGPACRLHGHTYRVEVVVRGPEIDASGVLLDIGSLQERLATCLAELHYQNLADVPSLRHTNTTAETMARFIWQQVTSDWTAPAETTVQVRVWESAAVFGGYESVVTS